MSAGTTNETPMAERWSLRSLAPHGVIDLRHKVGDRLTKWGYEIGDAVTVVGELLANVVQHAGGGTTLHAEVKGSELFLGVEDAVKGQPELQEPDLERDSGRGLLLIAALSSKWGVQETTHGKIVWAFVALETLCHECRQSVDRHADGVTHCRVIQPDRDGIVFVYCPSCSQQKVRERTGRDSGWGATLPCDALVTV
ncbi:ATP-binding protein [Streptomyces luteogriseus]|uniref:ATP-binding protein n=1 Tax=Streptomyces luteogriseus TaxID=68233 RepID=UPI0037BD6C37